MTSRRPTTALRRLLATLVLCLSLGGALATAPPAQAKDMNGRLGVGMETSLGGISGIAFRFWPTQDLGINVTAGFRLYFEEVSTGGDFGTSIATSLGVVYNFSQALHANLGIGFRVGVGYNSQTINKVLNPGSTGDVFQLLVEGPLLVMEFFLSDRFSISASTGVLFNWVSQDGVAVETPGQEELEQPDSLVIDFGGGGFSATLGLVYYF